MMIKHLIFIMIMFTVVKTSDVRFLNVAYQTQFFAILVCLRLPLIAQREEKVIFWLPISY